MKNRINAVLGGSFVAAAIMGSVLVGSGALAQTSPTTTPLSCNFPLPSVPAGQPAVLTATGGNGSYFWASPGLLITNPTGSSFTATFNVPGTYIVSVTSGGLTASCSILVTTPVPAGGTTTPGLPATGERE